LKKTLNENNSIETNWKTILLVLVSTVLGGFILIFSLFKNIENTQQIKVDPLANANQLTKKRIEILSNNESFYYDVYIAEDEESRATGLMNIKTLPENEGMLFIFPDSQIRSFWMKNTYLPLDIIFFDSSMKFINSHENTEPLNESIKYLSDKPAKYALELNAGMVNSLELNSESTLIIID
jgi:uncharacterized membrane protein (UPF0127 family)